MRKNCNLILFVSVRIAHNTDNVAGVQESEPARKYDGEIGWGTEKRQMDNGVEDDIRK